MNTAQAASVDTKVCRDKDEAKKERPIKIDQTAVINIIKQDMRKNHDKTIKQLPTLAEREKYIRNLIAVYLDGDNQRDNTEGNIDLIYAKLMKKKEDGETDKGFFQNMDNYTVQQVDEMREEELNRLLRQEQQKFLDKVNPVHSGQDFTIDGA